MRGWEVVLVVLVGCPGVSGMGNGNGESERGMDGMDGIVGRHSRAGSMKPIAYVKRSSAAPSYTRQRIERT